LKWKNIYSTEIYWAEFIVGNFLLFVFNFLKARKLVKKAMDNDELKIYDAVLVRKFEQTKKDIEKCNDGVGVIRISYILQRDFNVFNERYLQERYRSRPQNCLKQLIVIAGA
jgi:hypothetical protein